MLLESELKYFYHFISFWKVISSLRMKYPNSYNLNLQVSFCASQRLPFLWCTSLDDSPIIHPSGFGHAQGNRDVQEHQAHVLLYYWDTICIWQNTRHRQERSSTTKSRFGMTDSLSDHCSNTELFLPFLCLLTWRGAKWKKPSSLGCFALCCQSQECNRDLLYLGSKVNIFLILRWDNEEC